MALHRITSACSHVLHANVPATSISHMMRAEIVRLRLPGVKGSVAVFSSALGQE